MHALWKGGCQWECRLVDSVSEKRKGECIDVQGVSVWVSEGQLSSKGLLGTYDRPSLTWQPLLRLKSLPLPQGLQHLEGEIDSDWNPRLPFNQGDLRYLQGPYNHNAQGPVASAANPRTTGTLIFPTTGARVICSGGDK